MIETHDHTRGCAPHALRLWRWLSFDPPMRDPAWRGCRTRELSCTMCHCALGSTDDPMEGFLMAWRHRRQLRHQPRMGTAPG